MLLAAALVLALGWWLYRRDELVTVLANGIGSLLAGGLCLFLLVTDRPLAALIVGGATLWWHYRGGHAQTRRARRLLGLGEDAGPEAVQAAWRRAMQRAHPDAGGTAGEAQALTAARDLLLARNRRAWRP